MKKFFQNTCQPLYLIGCGTGPASNPKKGEKTDVLATTSHLISTRYSIREVAAEIYISYIKDI